MLSCPCDVTFERWITPQEATGDLAVLPSVRRCYVLKVGQVVFSGTPAELREHPVLTKTYLGAANSARAASASRAGPRTS